MSGTESVTYVKSTFAVPKMDCPSEENLIRMALSDVRGVASLSFDLPNRRLVAVHAGPVAEILGSLEPLRLGATHVGSAVSTGQAQTAPRSGDDAGESRTLWLLLAINGIMFVLELGVGLVAESAGLVADSLDMFADAAVYGLSLYAVGRAAVMKTRAAHLAGWLQLLLAIAALAEVARRFVFGSEPVSELMMGMGVIALVANVACLLLIARKRHAGVHMKASYIFSANDVLANAGVIAAGGLVAWTGSALPDLIIGVAIALLVLDGARRILQLR